MYKEIIGKNLKYLRDKKNVTQILAEEMTGIDRTTISAYELAKREPSVSNLISLANYYKVTLDFLCGRNQRMIIDITDLDELSKNKIMWIKKRSYDMNFKNIVNKLCSQFDSKAYDQDILKYGLEVLIYNLFTILILIVLSILFQNCGFGLYFIPTFCILRITLGGFHCKTIYGCTSLMVIIYSLTNILSKEIFYHNLLKIASPILIILLFIIKPCEENTLHLKNYNIYYKYLLIIIFSLVLIISKNKILNLGMFSALFVTELMYYIKYIINLENYN